MRLHIPFAFASFVRLGARRSERWSCSAQESSLAAVDRGMLFLGATVILCVSETCDTLWQCTPNALRAIGLTHHKTTDADERRDRPLIGCA